MLDGRSTDSRMFTEHSLQDAKELQEGNNEDYEELFLDTGG